MVDAKGDITNLLLHFPDLEPADFQPWIDPDVARREEITPEVAAEETANLGRNGLKEWDISPDKIRGVTESVQYAIYSPGSTSGIPISILASLAAPDLEWSENQEVLREKNSSTVTAILGLVGGDADPLQSKEHILLSNIFQINWSRGTTWIWWGSLGKRLIPLSLSWAHSNWSSFIQRTSVRSWRPPSIP